MDVDGLVTVVSGGGSGLGAAVTRKLVDQGAHVGILDLPTSDGEKLAQEMGARAQFVAADVTSPSQVGAALDALERVGTVRVAVNCAGIHPPGRATSFEPQDARAWFDHVVRVNLYGTFNVSQQVSRRMLGAELLGEERGVIVTTASVSAFDGQVGQVAYAAAKAGVAGMTLPLARELAREAIRVVSVAPGLFRTPLVDALDASDLSAWAKMVPHPQRWGHPDEFARFVQHAIENPMLNGETVRLDAAIRMPPVSGS